jgi:hypothetical protein
MAAPGIPKFFEDSRLAESAREVKRRSAEGRLREWQGPRSH